MNEPFAIACAECKKERAAKPTKKGEAKLPPGWKRHADGLLCRECWKDRFVLRAVTLPIDRVIEGGEWADFFAAVKNGWTAATDVSNWAVTELAKADTPRTAAQEKMADFKPPYLYPGARAVAPEIDPTSIVAILHAVEGKYRRSRLQTIWFRSASHPVYRYPIPVPIHNQSWKCVEGDGGRACISFRLAGRRWQVSLATATHRRQLIAWRRILAGEAVAGELAILGREARQSDHRRSGAERAAGGGRRRNVRVMAKLVAWFPKKEAGADRRDQVLYLHTCGEAFWVYRIGTAGEAKYFRAEHLKRWHAQRRRHEASAGGVETGATVAIGEQEDGERRPPIPIEQVKSWVHGHRRHVDRTADDMKHEKRWPKPIRRQAGEKLDLWTAKQRDRMDSFCHEATAMIAKFAERNGVRTVVYDSGDKSFVEEFPWHKLAEQLRYKLDERGITLEVIVKSDTDGGDDQADGASAPDAE